MEKLFPIQSERGYSKPFPTKIPWSVAEKAYGIYSSRYGRSQSLEELGRRGGFGPSEMDLFHPTWLEECSEIANLKACITRLEKALLPFSHQADIIDAVDGTAEPNFRPFRYNGSLTALTIGDCREARSALQESLKLKGIDYGR